MIAYPNQEINFARLLITVLLISVDGTLTVLSPLPGTGDNSPVTPGEKIQIPDRNRGELYKFKV